MAIAQQKQAKISSSSLTSGSRPRLALLVSQYLGVNAHGAEAHTVVSFIKMLNRHFEVEIVGGEVVPPEVESAPHFVYFRYKHFPHLIRKLLHIPAAFINILLYCYRRRPAVIMTTSGPSYGGVAAILSRLFLKVPVAIRATEDYVNHSRYTIGWWPTFRQYLLGNVISMFVLRHANMVLATGKRSREHFIANGVREERIAGVPGPIQRGRFWPGNDKRLVRRSLGLPEKAKIIMYVGGLQPFKGSEELIDIIERVLKQSNEFIFVIVGKEVRGTRITNTLLKIGGDRLIMVPPQPHEKLVSYYQAADSLLFLTKVGVGYGQVNIEATLCGTPVIAWDPGLDVKEFLGPCCFSSVEGIVDKILSGSYQVPILLPEQDDEHVISEHVRILNGLIVSKT